MSDRLKSLDFKVGAEKASWSADSASTRNLHFQDAVEPGLPLLVELDHDLVRTNLFVEALLALGSQRPVSLLRILPRLCAGLSAFKTEVSDLAELDVTTLPLRGDVIAFLTAERRHGRRIHLASASSRRLVEAVADHVGLFDAVVVPTDSTTSANVSDAEARGRLRYDDLERSVRVGAIERLTGRSVPRIRASDPRDPETAPSLGNRRGTGPIDRSPGRSAAYLRCGRPHQWLKNILILVPALAAHQVGTPLIASLVAFASFSLCASSVYILNDLLDLRADRNHPRKRLRPFASGDLPLSHGLILSPVLLGAAVAIAFALDTKFLVVLIGYYGLTCVYSFWLKRHALVDVVALACLYGIRLLAGGTAAGVALSPWLGALAIFLFFCLALVKRCTELVDTDGSLSKIIPGRGYQRSDLPILMNMATSSGFVAVLVLALYLNSEAVRAIYSHPNFLWAACVLLLFWISRILLLTHHGKMHDDPVVFAAKDRVSVSIACACVAIMAFSI